MFSKSYMYHYGPGNEKKKEYLCGRQLLVIQNNHKY